MGGTAAVITAGAALLGGGAAIYSGRQAKKEADRQAEETERRAEYEAERIEEEAERLKGRQRAAYAAAGVRVDEDTPLAVIQETQREAQREVSEVLRRGGYSARTAEREGTDLWRTGLFSGAGTLLKGGAETYERGRGSLWK